MLFVALFPSRVLPSVTRIPCFGRQFSRRQRYMSTLRSSNNEPLVPGTMLKADSGKIYKIDNILADRRQPLLCVYRASAEGKNFIIKNMIPGEFEYQLNLQKSLPSPNVRTVIDTVQQLELFIFPFLAGDLLRLSQKNLSYETRRDILRSALHDIKPNNILLDYEESADGRISITNVQISDLEDTVVVPPGKWLRGPLCGNAIWRSAESWCRSRQNQASDMFSFGIVMIYVMVNEMVFRVSDDQLNAEDSWRYILPRHISYFADEDGLRGFLEHIGEENPFYERLIALAGDFGSGNPRLPFEFWDYIDPDLRDLVGSMTSLDPAKRITAKEALGHRWFSRTKGGP